MPGLVAPTTDERQMLLEFLEQQRYHVRLAAYGLTDDEIRSTPSTSALSVGAIAKHLALVESFWMQVASDSFDAAGNQDEYERGLLMADDETAQSVLEQYALAAKATDELISSLDLDSQVPVPKSVPWFPQDVDSWSIRWIVLHLIEETARHAGHADIVRESIDGATAFPLMAAAEGWAPSPWIEPWQRAS